MYKAGVDILHNDFDGESSSRTVFIRRTNGTLARRLDYSAPTTNQSNRSTDLALFAQDRVQPNQRWFVEFGARLDRDGVIDQFNITPRVRDVAALIRSSGVTLSCR